MENEARKATDVLLELESKVDCLLQIVKSQDLNIKLLSNKLNIIMEKLEKQSATSPKIVVEAINSMPPNIIDNSDKNIPISSEFNLLAEEAPQGFRRTSRPETFAGDNAYLNQPAEKVNKFPMQIPKMPADRLPDKSVKLPTKEAEVVVDNSFKERPPPAPKKEKTRNPNGIPIVQRVVNSSGKSVFLAEIEIFDAESQELIAKTRTNGTGKWMSTLPIGSYKVILKKIESLTKEKIEVGQTIQVDGTQSPLELQTMIIK